MSTTQYIGTQIIRGEEITSWGIFSNLAMGVVFNASKGVLSGKLPAKGNMMAVKFASNIEKEMMKKIKRDGLKAGVKYYVKHIGKGFLKPYIKGTVASTFINMGVNVGLYWSEYGYNYLTGNL